MAETATPKVDTSSTITSPIGDMSTSSGMASKKYDSVLLMPWGGGRSVRAWEEGKERQGQDS